MSFEQIQENKNDKNRDQERLNDLADKLDGLQKEFARNHGLDSDTIPYVDWIVQDLRKGDLAQARINYEQQRDKFDNKKEIKKFLEDNNIVEKGIDWNAWKKMSTNSD
ncbi:MAG: hypothetical protein PWQ35_89 [Patescibacteria group bacterium]|nr:hypothetical protein [Patescibacteria group bacterium]